ncbi:hypothetical protein CIK05_15045 [Bdellovibrio sp. qaytius]|nr:hypothetical protein CIK05_15045 [Bdellovibrio sp. qaytius]
MRHLQTIATFVVFTTFIASFAQAGAPDFSDSSKVNNMTYNGETVDAETVNRFNIESQPYNKLIMTSGFSERVQPTIDKGEMPPPSDPSFIRRLREEIYKVEAAEAKKNQGEGTANVLRHVRTNFAPDSITFAIAGGLVYFTQLQLITKSDPALMVKHLESLKDPIAHISFGAFMVANGIYIDMKTRGLDPLTKQLAMKTLTYKGLAVGSFASSLTADLLVTLKECTKGWINNKNDQASQAACDFAYKQWTFRNKFVQYAPQILSLLAAQKGAEVLENGAKIGGRFLKPGIKAVDSLTVKFFRLSAANVDLLITGGGSVSVKAIRWIGKLTKFSMFLAVDHVLQPTISRIGNNLIQPAFFDFDAMAMNRYFYRGSTYGWNEKTANAAGLSFAKFPSEILNFTERMAAWRMHLNAKAEGDLAGWLEASSKLLHQVDYAKNFYLKYIENVYDTLNRQELVNKGEFNDAPERAWALERRYPFRILPLYGVKSNFNYGDVPENDIYLLKPFDIEPRQSEFVKQATISFFPAIGVSFGLSGTHLEEVKALIKPLTGNLTPLQQGVQLDKINQRFKDIPQPPMPTRGGYVPEDPNKPIRKALYTYKTMLGNPMPQLKEGMGFTMAFDTHVSNYQLGQEAGFDLKNDNYKFAKPSDLMMFNMICGPKEAHIDEGMFTGINLFAPRITNYNGELDICKNTWIMKNVTSDKIHDWKITVDGQTYANPTRFIIARMYPELLGNFRDEEKTDKGQGFDVWWMKNIIPTLQTTLKKMDERYGQVVEMADAQINDHKGYVDWAVDGLFNGSSYLDKNVGDNLRFEFEVYLRVLKTVLMNEKVTTEVYLKDVAEWSRNNRFNIPFISDAATAKRLVKENSFLLKLAGVAAEDITNLDDVSTKLILPAREKVASVKEKVLPTANNPTLASDVKTIEQGLNKVTAEMNKIRMLEFEVNYKNFIALLSRPNLKFDEMLAAKEKLYKSNTIILGGFKQMAEMAGTDNLPTEVQTILAVANGLEALEIEVNRFLLMKVKLADRLELDMSQLNTFLKAKSIAAPVKQGVTPHNH